jgi:hypothetical protein
VRVGKERLGYIGSSQGRRYFEHEILQSRFKPKTHLKTLDRIRENPN